MIVIRKIMPNGMLIATHFPNGMKWRPRAQYSYRQEEWILIIIVLAFTGHLLLLLLIVTHLIYILIASALKYATLQGLQ